MIPDLTALVSPVAQLIPAAAAPGIHPLTTLLGDAGLGDALSGLPALAESAVTGTAGTAVVSTLADAGQQAVELLQLSGDLELLAEEAVAAVTRAADDITVIAGQCAREVVALLMVSPLNPTTGAAAAQIGWEHLDRAAERLTVLESELDGLASQVEVVDAASPVAPASPSALSGAPESSAAANPASGAGTSTVADPGDTGDVVGAPTPEAAAAVEAAKTALGTPYSWGGTVPGQGLDCSGLTQWAYGQAGVDIPRTANAQAVGPQVPMDELAPGDLAVWDGHVAMVTGDGMMIEAGDPVQMSPVRTENIGMGFHGFYRPTG
ncbi:C40 family peptidase [Corynebacterium variabile]|uniref:NlpC/P60 family n=1 Tax=Corynebacterium variabile TaxID=1727 RepID=A0A0X2NJ66_9CORY|nr:C40 family peptidase [Corynebacterium variabile]CUU64808.1 NlpC/P60 family [Corynebacterium variabile]